MSWVGKQQCRICFGLSICLFVHPFSSIFIQVHPVSSIFIQVHPFSSKFIQFHPISSMFIQFHPVSSMHWFHWWCSLVSNMDIHGRWWSGDHFLEIVCWSVVWWGSMLRPWASKKKKRWCKEVYAHHVPQQWCWYGMKVTHSIAIYGGFLKYWYPTTMGLLKMIILGCFG